MSETRGNLSPNGHKDTRTLGYPGHYDNGTLEQQKTGTLEPQDTGTLMGLGCPSMATVILFVVPIES